MSTPIIDLVPLPFKLGSYSSDVLQPELQTNDHDVYGAIALSVFPAAAQLDHFITDFAHDNYHAVSGTVPLSAVAFNNRRVGSTTRQLNAQGFAPFPGDLNDTQRILCDLALQGKSPELVARLRLAKHLPATRHPLTIWPIEGGKPVNLTLSRLSGGSSITELVLWCVRLPASAILDTRNLTGLPHWIGGLHELAAAAGAIYERDVAVDPGDKWGLRLRQIFATAYNANDDSHDEAYLNAIKGRLRFDDREIYPNAGAKRLVLSSLYPQGVQDFDAARDPRLVIPDKHTLRHELETLVTAQAKNLYLTHYGTLTRVSSHEGAKVS